MNLGKGIRLLLDKKGLSQKKLAEEISMSETSVSLIIQNRTKPRKETLDAISRTLGVTSEVLLLLSIDRNDLQTEEKREDYDLLWPQVEYALLNLFGDSKKADPADER